MEWGNFQRSEFACKCGCGRDTVDAELLDVLNSIRSHFGKPLIVISGHRCATHNANVGGVANSQHKHGRAADFSVRNVGSRSVRRYIADTWGDKYYHYAISDTATHIDTRTRR